MSFGWLLERAARLLNRQIAASISASRIAAELEGRSCRFTVEGLPLDVIMRVEAGRIALREAAGEVGGDARAGVAGGLADANLYGAVGQADVAIAGTPFDLLKLAGPDAARRMRETGVRLNGEVHVAEKFANLLRLARPDLEEELAGWIGDIPAHALGLALSRAGAWVRMAGAALRDDAAEYLKEEYRALPSFHEAEAFYADVERLRDDVERSAARLERLGRTSGAR
ncbi:MAG TPA: hypothetical protein VFY39_13385 [Gammaproteobacteria bacterium]|nr:hypothetical protein [Gammaproteobacteria bacterium]